MPENDNTIEDRSGGEPGEQSPQQPPVNEGATTEELFKTVEELKKKLAEAEQQASQYKDLLLRKAADFENYKKRMENESANIIKFATEELIGEIIPILDDLERSLKLGKEKNETSAFYRGIELIHQKLLKVLQAQGVRSFETLGKQFDVQYHDALLQMPREDVPAHTVLEEVEKGYMLNDKVVRHAKVVVSAVPAAEEATPSRGSNHEGSSNS